MTSKNTRRKISSPISASRWVAYTTAGAATALAGAASADAAVNVINVNQTFSAPAGSSAAASFQLSTPGQSIGFQHVLSSSGSLGGAKFGIFGGGAFVGATFGNYAYAAKLAAGANIAGAAFAVSNVGTLAFGIGYAHSQWKNAGTGYIGFKFTDAAGQEYGWANVTAQGTAGANVLTLNSYAYTTAGEVITAGQTSAIPEPGSLSLLAVGGAGLLAWRKRRAKMAVLPA